MKFTVNNCANLTKHFYWLFALILFTHCQSKPQNQKYHPVDLFSQVDPFIGTGGNYFSTGSAYPGPALPFGMIHAGPDTRGMGEPSDFSHCSGYSWEDYRISGFSLTRMHGTGMSDYGTIAIMPTDNMSSAKQDENGYAVDFQHSEEMAEPGYYRVRLENGIQVEITSSLRAAIFRFQFPKGMTPVVLFDFDHALGGGSSAGGEISVEQSVGSVAGWIHNLGQLSSRFGGFRVYAEARVQPLPNTSGVWDDTGLHADTAQTAGNDIGAWFSFTAETSEILVRVGISFVDLGGAHNALEAEIPDFNFDHIREDAANNWRAALNKVELFGATKRDATVFATALYHSLLMPTLMSDIDGRYVRVDGSLGNSTQPRYSDFSLWDTYRTLHPWLLFTENPLNQDFAASLVGFGQEGGAIPRWPLAHGDTHCMIGDPGVIVLAESALKGVSFSEAEAYGYALATAWTPASGPTGGRSAISSYVTYGYVPADVQKGSVSETLEYVAADLSLANWAEHQGQMQDAQTLEERANQAWRSLYDTQSGFFWGRNTDGSRVIGSEPLYMNDLFVEGNAWQYLWMLPNNAAGLSEALGGPEAARLRLRGFFESSSTEEPFLGFRSWYWHGNEPDLIAPWLFAAWGAPEETFYWVKWIADTQYNTTPDGLAGNDDSGTLSAWYLFASSGLYPIAGTDRYLLGAPRQPRLVLHRDSGTLTIETILTPHIHPIPIRIFLDGKELDDFSIRHADLVGEHVLRFVRNQ